MKKAEKESNFNNLHSMLRHITDNIPDLLWTKDLKGQYTFANRATCERLLMIRDSEEAIGKTDLYFAEREKNRHPENPEWHTFGEVCTDSDTLVLETGKTVRFDEYGNVEGKLLVLDVMKVPLLDDEGNLIGTIGSGRDITEQKSIETRLKESEEKYRSYFENSPLSLWEEDFTVVMAYLNELPVAGVEDIRNYLDAHPEEVKKCVGMVKILDVNPATLKMYDAQSKEDLFWNLGNIFTDNSYESFVDELIKFNNNERMHSAETVSRTLSGRIINTRIDMVLLSGYRVLVTITDITELKNKEIDLKELLAQTRADSETKEILLREINHRVKNNLSAFIGILYAEKRQSCHKMKDTQLDLIDGMINRVKGISIAHNLLSMSGWTPISVYTLSEKIIHSLSHLVPTDRLIETNITPSSVFLNADQSQNMAVVINELFANCIEHAVNAGDKIKVKIEINERKGKISYIYSDNGPGFPEKVLNSGFHNVGLYLIKNIVQQNLRGTIKMENKGGARVILKFPGGTEFEEL